MNEKKTDIDRVIIRSYPKVIFLYPVFEHRRLMSWIILLLSG